jgi:DNA-directed RNA polymerase sigma subunit (sigma70/sigma32)
LGARRALRLYRKAEAERDLEHAQVEARLAARKLLATGDITGKRARALRLYTGIEDGKWRTYKEVGQVMGITSQAVSQLLLPSKIVLERILADRSPETGFPKR